MLKTLVARTMLLMAVLSTMLTMLETREVHIVGYQKQETKLFWFMLHYTRLSYQAWSSEDQQSPGVPTFKICLQFFFDEMSRI